MPEMWRRECVIAPQRQGGMQSISACSRMEYLRVIETMAGVGVRGVDEQGRVAIGENRLSVGIAPHNDVVVTGAVIGGRTTFYILADDAGATCLAHAGHAIAVLLNGEAIGSHLHRLSHGDIIELLNVEARAVAARFEFESVPPRQPVEDRRA